MREQNPNVPYTPAEIATEALRSWRAGAAVVHVHVRDPLTGAPAFDRGLFAEVIDRIRAESDMLINLTTSALNLTGPDVGRQRLMPLELKPDLCSLDVGTLNFRGGRVFINPSDWVETAAHEMRRAGVKPEMEVFDLGHIRQANDMVDRGLLEPPPYFQLCLGAQWGIEASLDALMSMKARLPAGCSVVCFGSRPSPIAADHPRDASGRTCKGRVRRQPVSQPRSKGAKQCPVRRADRCARPPPGSRGGDVLRSQ